MKKAVKNEIQVWPFLIQNSQSVFRFQSEQFFSDMGWCQNYFYVIADEGLFPKASISVDKIFRWTKCCEKMV